MLSAIDLTVGFTRPSQCALLENMNLSLEMGRVVCLLGPNGAGKTTLLRTLIGMHPPIHGRVQLNGDDIHRLSRRNLARRIGVVLTDRVMPAMMTAYELVSLGRQPYTGWLGALSLRDQEIVEMVLEATHTGMFASRLVSELSDGERQRVFVARALAQQPDLLVLDEPTAFLDLPHRVELMTLLRQLTREQHCAALISTHDLDLALRFADEIWLLDGRGGFATGTPAALSENGAFTRAFGIAFDLYQHHTI